jgi:hypothetical protein
MTDEHNHSASHAAAPSHTPREFCELERISRTHLYNMWSRGKGPRFYNAGATVRITEAARQDWHRQREAEASKTTRGGNRAKQRNRQ